MVFQWPGSLLGLVAIAAVAAWALFRPGRQLAVVGSLTLWRKAVDSVDRSARRSSRRISPSWLLLLGGAVAAVLGLARPVHYSQSPSRRIAIALCPSAELAGQRGRLELLVAAEALLDRLDPLDHVQLLLPARLGGASAWLRRDEARRRLSSIEILPIGWSDLPLPPPATDTQHTYRFVPAGAASVAGRRVSVIELPANMPPVTIEALGAAELADGKTNLFIALRNAGASAWTGRLEVSGLPLGAASGPWRPIATPPVTIQPGARGEIVQTLESVGALSVAVGAGEWGRPGGTACLARRMAVRREVALTGPDEPLLRRFVAADASLELVGSPEGAQIVFAHAAAAPPDKPALLIDPPADPPGCRRGEMLRDVVLNRVDVAGDDAVMRHVDLESVAVRRLRPWVSSTPGGVKVLASYRGDPIILRTEGGAAAGAARRVYVAFDLSTDNTNLSMSEAFVVFLANTVRWLAPPGEARPTYGYVTPSESGPAVDWRRLAGVEPAGVASRAQLLPWPGVFRDAAGRLVAVSLPGLRGRSPRQPPAQAVAAAPLPLPEPCGRRAELWPFLAAAAVGLWLAGWWFRLR